MFLTRFSFFGLFHVVLTFCFIFFGLVPPLEVVGEVVYWGGSSDVFERYSDAMLLCILGITVFVISYYKFFGRQGRLALRLYKANTFPLIIISALSAMIIYWYNGFSVASVFVRGGEFAERVALGQTAWLIYQYALYPFPSICLVVYLVFGERRPLPTLFLFVIFLAANPASGMARFQAAALYIAVLIALLPRMWQQRSLMIGVLVGGVFLVLPVLDRFRRYTSDTEFGYSISFIYQGHFDSFQMFALSLGESDLTWGTQLIGAILFFVPRAIWPEKPISSGALVADESSLVFDNISFAFFAEGYINFGIFGVILFAVALGWFAARFDTRARTMRLSGRDLVYYHFAVGLIFFFMRGSLMNGVAFATGAYFAIFLVMKLSGKSESFLSQERSFRLLV